jgi:hypothetical protein
MFMETIIMYFDQQNEKKQMNLMDQVSFLLDKSTV